jgi:hypothetical protein
MRDVADAGELAAGEQGHVDESQDRAAMDDIAEVALVCAREDAAAGMAGAFGADEELADAGVVAVFAGNVPGPPAGVVGVGGVVDQGVHRPINEAAQTRVNPTTVRFERSREARVKVRGFSTSLESTERSA